MDENEFYTQATLQILSSPRPFESSRTMFLVPLSYVSGPTVTSKDMIREGTRNLGISFGLCNSRSL